MKFKNWLSEQDTIICIDLDNTLLDRSDKICVRPGVQDFLSQIQKLGKCIIYTYGLTKQQEEVASSVGIDLPIVGRDLYKDMDASGNYILIDNNPPDHHHTVEKMESLGIDSSHLVHVKGWHCGDGPDDELQSALTKVKKLLSQNEWVEKDIKKEKKQPFKTYTKAKDLAQERKKLFTKKLEDSADGHKVIVDIKSAESFENKTKQRGKNPKKVFDVLRASILVDKESQMDDVISKIKKNFEVKTIEHKTDPSEDKFGYYGPTHIDVILDDMVCEIHIMTHKMWEFKYKAHEFYSKYRSKENPPKEIVKKTKELYKKGNGDN